ncbi:MAG: hypothetical protein F6K14_28145 [Symploca sp. SIO2C1]|nr:hypothetical protein [Symploca sp. SIO2C1]
MMTYQPEQQQQPCQVKTAPTVTKEPTSITNTAELVLISPLEKLDPNTLLEHPDSASSIILSLAIFILALASFLKVLIPVMLQKSNKQ